MCLISISPKGVNKYTEHFKNIIENAMYFNSSGTGFAIYKDKSNIVCWKKGYNAKISDTTKQEFERLWDDLKNLKLENNDILVVHSRIATVGKAVPYNTHPFLIAPYENLPISGICGIEGKTKEGVLFHNGTFAGYKDNFNDYSDTCHLTHDLFTDNQHMYNYLLNKPNRFQDTFKSVLGPNKVAILNPEKELILFGNFVTDAKGYIHSHQGYDPLATPRRSFNYTDRSRSMYGVEHDYDSYDEVPPNESGLGDFYEGRYPTVSSHFGKNNKAVGYNANRESVVVEPEVISQKKFSPIIDNTVVEENENGIPQEYAKLYTEIENTSGYYKGLYYLINTHPLYLNYFLAFPTKDFAGQEKYTELTLCGSLTEDNVMLKNGTTVTKCPIKELIGNCIIIPKPEFKKDLLDFIKLINSSKSTSSYLEYIVGRMGGAGKNQLEIQIKKPVKGKFTKTTLQHYVDFYKLNGYLDEFLKRKRDKAAEEKKLEQIPDWNG